MTYSKAQLQAMAKHVLAKLNEDDGDPSADYVIQIMCQVTRLSTHEVMLKIEGLSKGKTVT